MSDWRIAPATPADQADWAAMRARLWAEDGAAAHQAETAAALADPQPDLLTLIARDRDGRAAGFAEASIRYDHVNGCDGSPVLFLEGIHVEPAARGRGLGRALVEAVASWGHSLDVTEFASDALVEDAPSHGFHRALGFVETERVVFFRRAIG